MTARPEWRTLDDYVRGVIDRRDIPGMAVAVARNGEVVHARGAGLRDRQRQLPVTENTVFGIGSITKSLTAAAVMQLEEEGELSLHDPVIRHLPEFSAGPPDCVGPMTIHHFLTHTSGLPPLPSLVGAMARSMAADPSIRDAQPADADAQTRPIDTPTELMEFIAGLDFSPLGRPGTIYSYSNDCYALLGTIIERVTGRSYQDEVMDRLIKPLGMNRTVFDLDDISDEDVTTLYTRAPGEGGAAESAPVWWESPAMVAAGFIRSTVLDLLRYMEVYRCRGLVGGGRILEQDSVRRMITPQFDYFRTVGYGYGFRVQRDYHGVTLVEHSGGLKGVAAHVVLVPEAGVTAAVLSNIADAPSAQVALAAVNTALHLPLGSRRLEPCDYVYPRAQLARLAGRYVSGEGFSSHTDIVLSGDRLEARSGDGVAEVRLIGPHACLIYRAGDDEGVPAWFLSGLDGVVWALHLGGRVLRRERGDGERGEEGLE